MSGEAPEGDAGARMSGVTTFRVCRSCGHRHEQSDQIGWDSKSKPVAWVTACPECSCVANNNDFYGASPTYNLDNYRADYDHNDDAASSTVTVTFVDPSTFNGCHFTSASVPDGITLVPGRRDAGGVRGLDEGGRLRGGRLGGFVRGCLSRLTWNQRDQLVGEWGNG